MPKPGKAAQQRRDRESVDMTAPAVTGPAWVPPPPDECEESASYTIDPSGEDMTRERVKVRMVDHVATNTLVEFAVIQQTFYKGQWRTVAEADSSHDDEVHVHRWSRKRNCRVGSTEQIKAIECAADVSEGYEMAYDRIASDWAGNKQRWHDG